jgi:hypothetical protein
MVKFLCSVIYLQAAAGLRISQDDSNPVYCAPREFAKVHKAESAVVTWAGIDGQPYIDGAIMLGRALVSSVPSMHLECLVGSTMSTTNKELLKNAGWNVREIEPWCPKKAGGAYWRQSYSKINAFRLPFQKVIYLDADTYIFSKDAANKLFDQLEAFPAARGGMPNDQILMARDVNDREYNSGVMIFSPSEDKFEKVAGIMDDPGMLDQPAINKIFEGKIQELSRAYNTHGPHNSKTDCDNAIVAHFTGPRKPALAMASNLEAVRSKGGSTGGGGILSCPQLYHEYYRRLQTERKYLTPALAQMLD